mgnify:CR=1 FL=1
MSCLIISPHLDDAILSLGGFLSLMQNLNCKVITIFNTAWSIDKDIKEWKSITKKNLAEEKKAMRELRCDFKFLNYPEALLRGYIRWNDALDLKKDKKLFEKITRDLLPEVEKYDNIFLPRGIGKHVDHLLIREMFTAIPKSQNSIFFYEDLPYSCYEEFEEYDKEMNILIDISRVINIKTKLLNIYKSQLDMDTIEMVEQHSLKLGRKGRNCERIWKLLEY